MVDTSAPAPFSSQKTQSVPLKMVGGNQFGRYSKISDEQTWNFIVSDKALVPYAGYRDVAPLLPDSIGRGLLSSQKANQMFAVVGGNFYRISASLFPTFVSSLDSISGDVYMAENNANQICITDGLKVYIYNYSTNVFTTLTTGAGADFPFDNPGYVSFQNGRFIIACLFSQKWVLSEFNDGLTWFDDAQHVGAIETKPGNIQAAVPAPGRGNNIMIFSTNAGESFQDLSLALFPYQRNSSTSIDYGCLNASSIGALEDFIVWLSYNEQSGPSLMYSQGTTIKRVSTDGIDFKLANLTNPANCTGFLFRQDGHLIYQFTFPDDNLSYAYDFNTGLFFTVTDENLNYHIAREVVFFNNKYYFVSLKGGNIFEFSSDISNADYGEAGVFEIPRLRMSSPLRLLSQRYYIIRSVGFTIEQGEPNRPHYIHKTEYVGPDNLATEDEDLIATESGLLIGTESGEAVTVTFANYPEVVDLSISRDGGASFGNSLRLNMNPTGQRKSRFIWQRLGIANDTTFQFRFSGFQRFVVLDGEVDIYQ